MGKLFNIEVFLLFQLMCDAKFYKEFYKEYIFGHPSSKYHILKEKN